MLKKDQGLKMTDIDTEKNKHKFTYNWIDLCLFLSLFLLIVPIAFSISDGSPYGQGQALGSGLSIIVIPSIIAWLVWRLSRRNIMAGKVTLRTLMIIFFIIQFNALYNKNKVQSEIINLKKSKNELNELLNDPKSLNEREYASKLSESNNNSISLLKTLEDNSKGTEKDVVKIINNTITKCYETEQSFLLSMNNFNESNYLEAESYLTTDSVYSNMKIVNSYKSATIEYRNALQNVVPEIKAEIEKLDDHAKAMEVVTPFLNRQLISGRLAINTADHTIEYLDKIDSIYIFVHSSRDYWTFEDGIINFESEFYELYIQQLESLAETEKKLIESSAKVREHFTNQ